MPDGVYIGYESPIWSLTAGSVLVEGNMPPFIECASRVVDEERVRRMTHWEIFLETQASTTKTVNMLAEKN